MNLKPFKDWENIFLDTTIIISLLLSARPNVTDQTVLFVRKLITYLTKNKAVNGERRFYVSSITIAELWNKASSNSRVNDIVKAIDSENTTIVPFDSTIAELMGNNYHEQLNNGRLNDFARSLSWPEHDLLMAREWILRDIMIIGTCDYLRCEVLLTTDRNTMFNMADKLGVPCALAYSQYFNQSEQFILGYDYK